MPGFVVYIKAELALVVFLRKPSKATINNSLRSIKQTAVWRLSSSPTGKHYRLRHRSAEWTVSNPWLSIFFRLYILYKTVKKLYSFFFSRNV